MSLNINTILHCQNHPLLIISTSGTLMQSLKIIILIIKISMQILIKTSLQPIKINFILINYHNKTILILYKLTLKNHQIMGLKLIKMTSLMKIINKKILLKTRNNRRKHIIKSRLYLNSIKINANQNSNNHNSC